VTKKTYDDDFALQPTPYQRLKYIRTDIVRLSRQHIQEKYGLSATTLKAWENGVAKLTIDGLEKCRNIYCQEGLPLEKNWLLPKPDTMLHASVLALARYKNYQQRIETLDDSNLFRLKDAHYLLPYLQEDAICIVREASIFKELYPDAVILVVTGDEMLPKFRAGDYVGGRLRYGHEIETTLNRDCIVRLADGRDVLRCIVRGHNKDRYNLGVLNFSARTEEAAALFDIEIIAAAPVIWHRMPND
jgi:hypothetical protein